MKVIVSGSSGLIGTALAASLESDGHDVTRLVRGRPGPADAAWDPEAGSIDAAALEGHAAAVHLAGAGIGDHRWTEAHKATVLASRVKGTTLLAEALAELASPPRVLVTASAVGIYGDRGDEELTEASDPGTGFLADVCRAWEEAAAPAEKAGIRTARIRTGIVLSRHGGALARLLLPFRLGLGGRVGSGRQWFSWISIDDEVAAIRRLLDDGGPAGPVNLTAPNPVRQADFAATLAAVLHRPAVLPTPVFALKAVMGAEMVDEMLLAGQRVLPAALRDAGFEFAHPHLEGALRHVLGR